MGPDVGPEIGSGPDVSPKIGPGPDMVLNRTFGPES